MKGLTEAIREREERRTRVEKIELDDDVKAHIGERLSRLIPPAPARLTFYSSGHYITVEATVTELNPISGYLRLGHEKIFFDDIIKVENL